MLINLPKVIQVDGGCAGVEILVCVPNLFPLCEDLEEND